MNERSLANLEPYKFTLEGKPVQALNVKADPLDGLAEAIAAARKRATEMMSDEDTREKIKQLEEQLGRRAAANPSP